MIQNLLDKSVELASFGDIDEAIDVLEKVISIEPYNETALLLLASYSITDSVKFNYLSKLLDVNPNHEEAQLSMHQLSTKLLQLAIDEINSKNKEHARVILTNLILHNPQDENAWMWFFQTMHTEAELLQALRVFKAENPSREVPTELLAKIRSQRLYEWEFISSDEGFLTKNISELGIEFIVTKAEYNFNKSRPRRIFHIWPDALPLKDRLGILRPLRAFLWGYYDERAGTWMRYPLNLQLFWGSKIINQDDDIEVDGEEWWLEDYYQIRDLTLYAGGFVGKSPGYYLYKGAWYMIEHRIEFKDEILLIKDAYRKYMNKIKGLRAESHLYVHSTVRQPIPDEIQIFVWNRDGGRCVKCGSQEKLEFDHIIPLSKGGSNTARNIQILCQRCNRAKKDKIGH